MRIEGDGAGEIHDGIVEIILGEKRERAAPVTGGVYRASAGRAIVKQAGRGSERLRARPSPGWRSGGEAESGRGIE